jgi:DNA-directed RNA polymerase subunit A"
MSEELQTNYLDEITLPKKLLEEIETVVREKRLNKEQRKKLEEEVKKRFINSKVEPGEVIGIIAAQSISEPATQMTMRTYHFAGTAGIKVTYGLPRLIEIFDAKKELETPMMTIYLKKQFNSMDVAKKIGEEIVEKKIFNLVKKVSLNLNENTIEIELLDKKRLGTVIKAIRENVKDVKVKLKGDKISVATKPDIEIKELQKLKEKILNIYGSGIENIINAVVRRDGDDWIINTIGSNLEKVLAIKEIDWRRTRTNDVYEIAKVLGIEAARNVIIEEALKTLNEQGLDVDIRHVMLVGDIMTLSGEIRSIGRYGIAGAKTSILARAAFEETIKHLVRASIRNEVDDFQGIFENVMIGQVIPSGTGMFDLVAKFEESSEEKK